jgi:ElaB/YqjD/DUF883 family membrane-anchored ribosome-binding protein
VVAGNYLRLHDGQLYLHPAGRRHHHDLGPVDPGKTALSEPFKKITSINYKSITNTNMKTHQTTHKTNHREEVGENLMEDAQALLSATAHVAEEKVIEARQRLSAAIERGKEAWHTIQDKAIAGAKATDQVIRDNPYKALGVAFGVGAIIGYLLRRRD